MQVNMIVRTTVSHDGSIRIRGQASCRRSGIVLMWMAVCMLVFIGFVGLAIDTAFIFFVAHELQNTADAAALAARQEAKNDIPGARAAAAGIAHENFAAGEPVHLALNPLNDANGDIVVGRFDRMTAVFTPTTFAVNAVKVVARRTDTSLGGSVALFFGPVFGLDTLNVEASAIAMVSGGTGNGLIALNSDAPCALTVSGSVTVLVNDGDIQVNCTNPDALCATGSAIIDAPTINVTGDAQIVGNVTFTGDVVTQQPAVADPLAWLPPPTWDPLADLGTVSLLGGEILTISPGYYSGGITALNGTLTLEPGIYILDGVGLDVTGMANLYAAGVMFYITGTGCVNIRGTGEVRIQPPDPDLYMYPYVDTYEGVSIFQDRNNTNTARIIGTGLLGIAGTVYFPSNQVRLGGTGSDFGSQLIASTVEIFGNGEITINYDGRNPSVGNNLYLVQ